MRISSLFFSLVFIVGLSATHADNVPPSTSPPGGLQPAQVPQFVNWGFDDNYGATGIRFILDYFKNKKNPSGNGNTGTYDGTPARVCFYITTTYSSNKALFEEMLSDDHEVGNHTVKHDHGADKTKSWWLDEINGASSWLKTNLGMTSDNLWGFRVPFLEYNSSTFDALKDAGLIYDCTLHGDSWGGDGSNYNWPYTMDNGSPGQSDAGTHPGVWEVPTHYVVKTDGSKITGLDYNMIELTSVGGAQMNKSQTLAALKHTLDQRYNGNRAPMTFGAHSHFYGVHSDDDDLTHIPLNDRQAVLTEFFDYALSKPDVRVVSSIDIIKWMRNPVKLNDINIVDTTDPSESLLEIAGWEAEADEFGSTVDTGSASINSGVMKVSFNQVAQPNDSTWPWVSVTAYTDPDGKFDNLKWIKVTYKCDKPVLVSLPQPPLSNEGTSYQLQIPTASSFQTVLLKIADFKQPSWVTTTTPLNLPIIHDVMFAPVVDEATGGTATLEINNVILYGYQEATPIGNNFSNAIPSGLFINKVTHERINISIPKNGVYTLSIYSVDGKLIKTVGNQYLTGGSHSITWNSNVLGTKLYLITLQGNNVQAVKKVLIQ